MESILFFIIFFVIVMAFHGVLVKVGGISKIQEIDELNEHKKYLKNQKKG